MTFLDEEFLAAWCAAGHELLGSASGTVVIKTSGGPDGKASASLEFSDGVLRGAVPGTKRGADLVLEVPWQLAFDTVHGTADPAEHYMLGDLKVSGDLALWLELLPAWRAAGTLGAPPAA